MRLEVRDGKDATLVDQLELLSPDLEEWLEHLEVQLGCVGEIEGGAIVLPGDLRKRVGPALEARGVHRVYVV